MEARSLGYFSRVSAVRVSLEEPYEALDPSQVGELVNSR